MGFAQLVNHHRGAVGAGAGACHVHDYSVLGKDTYLFQKKLIITHLYFISGFAVSARTNGINRLFSTFNSQLLGTSLCHPDCSEVITKKQTGTCFERIKTIFLLNL